MGTKAYILIETSVGKTREVANALNNTKEIHSVNMVTGPYDVNDTNDSTDMNTMGNLVTDKMHSLSGVVRTVTCVVIGT